MDQRTRDILTRGRHDMGVIITVDELLFTKVNAHAKSCNACGAWNWMSAQRCVQCRKIRCEERSHWVWK